jgi:hypothetical protein
MAILVVVVTLAAAERGAAASAPLLQPQPHALLDVPYLPQTEQLCGGAAVAMVLRYWGERDVFAQDFAPLVGTGDDGIFTSVLASAVRNRGWQALVMPASRTQIRSEIDRGRPLIALIEVGPRTYHYVVIVGSTEREIVAHDPARAPFRVLPWADFDRAWAATGRWMMLVLPPDGLRLHDDTAPSAALAASSSDSGVDGRATLAPCDALVARSVDLALAGDRDNAEQGLVAATGLCPNHPDGWRELAGLRFVESRWSEALDLAVRAVRLAPEDAYAWQLVAASRHLTGDLTGALDAWNRVDEPRIDTVEIFGAERTRQPVIAERVGLQPRQILTPESLGRAVRRLQDLPVVSDARMRYEPIDGGRAKVDVFVHERDVAPKGLLPLAALGALALLRDELRVDVGGPAGAGELWSAMGRWSDTRPRLEFALALPAPGRLPGIASLDVSWERQSYGATPPSAAGAPVRESRRRVGLSFADWATSRLRWRAGAAFDRLDQRGALAVDGALDARVAGDRVALGISGGSWAPLGAGRRFGAGELFAAWRSSRDASVASWSVATTLAVASDAAPFAVWAGAGTGRGRALLLRAHPLLLDGVVEGPVFGRRVAQGSIEYERPVRRTRAGRLALAGFLDTAKASHRMDGPEASLLHFDAGIGLRLHAPGLGGAVRIDLARGLRDGQTRLSAGWVETWPR